MSHTLACLYSISGFPIYNLFGSQRCWTKLCYIGGGNTSDCTESTSDLVSRMSSMKCPHFFSSSFPPTPQLTGGVFAPSKCWCPWCKVPPINAYSPLTTTSIYHTFAINYSDNGVCLYNIPELIIAEQLDKMLVLQPIDLLPSSPVAPTFAMSISSLTLDSASLGTKNMSVII